MYIHTNSTNRASMLSDPFPIFSQGEVLDYALSQLDPKGGEEHQSQDALAREVADMKEEVATLKSQLHTLNSIRKKLT